MNTSYIDNPIGSREREIAYDIDYNWYKTVKKTNPLKLRRRANWLDKRGEDWTKEKAGRRVFLVFLT